jgi:class 3 adenylate cyclase
MPSENAEQRKLAAIMSTDMVGYSRLAQRNEKLALELLEEHRALSFDFPEVQRHRNQNHR